MDVDLTSPVTLLVTLLAGGGISQIISIAYQRWKEVRGSKRRAEQELAQWREACYRARNLAIQLGADPGQLGPLPDQDDT